MCMSDISELLQRLGVMAQAENRQLAGTAALQPVHIDVLRYLARCNRYSNTPAAVGQFLNTTKGTVSQSVKVLEREKLVSKLADAKDGRVVRLRLLRKGVRLLEQLDKKSTIQAAIERLGDPERAALGDSLKSLLRHAQHLNDSRSFGICRTCRFFRRLGDDQFQCGITEEPLSADDAQKICVEHAASVSGASGKT